MAIGNFGIGGFRIPGVEDIDIEELVAQYKRPPTQSKKTKPKPKPKPKPRPKPKPKSRPKAPKAAVMKGMEDFAKAPVATSRPKTKPKPKPKPAIVSKPKPKPRPKPKVRPSIMGGEDLAVRPTSKPTKVVSKPQFKPKGTPRPSPVYISARPKISSEDLMKVASQTKGRPNIPNVGMSGVIPGTNVNIEEIIEQATQGQSLDPTKYIRERNEIREKFSDPVTLGGSTDPTQQTQTDSQETKKKSESMSDEEMLSILQKLFKTEQPQQQPQMPKMPQLPQVQQWDMMGQQQTGSMMPTPMSAVVKGPFMPSPIPPQMPSQMFGGYGGTAPIVPAMAYAGMGNFPQMPRMPRMPSPQYDPDAEPGGPAMPTGPVFT